MSIYAIRAESNSAEVMQTPIEGVWYCHFVTRTDPRDGTTFHSSGNLAQWVSGEFVDEEGENVSMVHDDLPCFLLPQI